MVGMRDVCFERFEFAKELFFVHDGGAGVFDEGGGYVVGDGLGVDLEGAVEVLGDAVGALGEDLLVFVCL